MLDIEKIKGVIFDYGGTIDSNGMHWAEVIWMAYEDLKIPVSKETFRDAYVYGERTLATNKIVFPHHNFRNMMAKKARLQIEWLVDNNKLDTEANTDKFINGIADWCYGYAQNSISNAYGILKQLAEHYPMVLVSNFYGNIESVLKDFKLDGFFQTIIESAVVGVRKPDPEIFRLGLNALELPAEEVVVIGDSYDKDIVPATSLSCQTIWLKNIGWSNYTGEEKADLVISDFKELKENLLAEVK